MKYVVVKSRVEHLPKRGKQFYGVDPQFPLLCQEFDSLEEAQKFHAENPGSSEPYTEEQYNEHKKEMDQLFQRTWKKRPFWKFWG